MTDGGAHLVIRCEALERVTRALLVRLLEGDAAFFAAHGVSLDAIAQTAQEDRALVRRVHALVDLHEDAPAPSPPTPIRLREQLAAYAALASATGREAIARADREGKVPRTGLSDEDLAATALLDFPEIAARARPGLVADAVNGFTVYRAADARPIDLATNARAIERGFGAFCDARDRTAACEVHVRDGVRFTEADVRHGRPPAARDHIDRESLAIRQSVDTIAQSARMVLDKEKRCLLVHASHASLKDGLRRVVGEVCAGNPEFFTTRALYDLSPLRDAATFAPGADLPAIAKIELRAITLRAPNGVAVSFGSAPDDLFAGPWGTHLESAFEVGAPVAAKVALLLHGRTRPAVVDLKLPGSVKFARRDAALARAVDDFFVARGITRLEEIAAPPTLAETG